MAEISAISAYMQNDAAYKAAKSKSEVREVKTEDVPKESKTGKVNYKSFTPLNSASSLIPQKTEYGFTIGDVKLSDAAKDYYEKLKSKFHNMEFIAVSKDMKAAVQANAAAYGNANKMVVLVDDEKLERMATDEEYRKKYEGIIAMASNKLTEAKNSLASTGASVKNFGMSVDSNGNASLFATVEKSQELQKERIEKQAEAKREQKIKDKKNAQKKEQEKNLEKIREKNKAEKADKEKSDKDIPDEEDVFEDDKEYVTIEANSMEALLNKVSVYSFGNASARVMTEAEKALGGHIDFRG